VSGSGREHEGKIGGVVWLDVCAGYLGIWHLEAVGQGQPGARQWD
jgi:hypothetical protein